jgi:hypothetical protein
LKNFNFNFESIQFKTNWATLSALAALLVWAITLQVTNIALRADNQELKVKNEALTQTVETIDDTLEEIVLWKTLRDKTILEITKYPPNRIETDMQRMERNILMQIQMLHGVQQPIVSSFQLSTQAETMADSIALPE